MEIVKKKTLSRQQRLLRAVGSIVDPRAYLHLLKIVNYYNYTHVQPLRAIRIGAGAAISPDTSFANAERITLGDRVRIGSRCHLWAGPAVGSICFGNDVLLGPEVMITAANYRFNDGSPVTDQPMDEGDVTLGDDVWLGTRAIVLPGVSIGSGAVVGAASVVTKDLPAWSIAVGSPARVIGERTPAAGQQSARGEDPDRNA